MKKPCLLALAGAVLATAPLAAQACLGLPTLSGQYAITGFVETTEAYRGVGVNFSANLPSSLLAEATYRLDDPEDTDETGQTFGGRLGFELPFDATSICPIVGATYSTISRPALLDPVFPPTDVQVLRVPVLLGVGQRLDLPGEVYVVPSARGGFVWMRTTLEPEGLEPASTTATEILMSPSVVVGRGAVFARGDVSVTTEEATRPRFALGIGFLFP